MSRSLRRGLAACVAALPLAVAGGKGADAADAGARIDNVVRYVSLRASKVNLRKGPGRDYPIAWVFQRAGLPVEIIREFDVWRQVRDASGTVGWVHSSMLSGRRTALILPWEVEKGRQPPRATLREDDNEKARAVAQMEAGVLVSIDSCENGWCYVSVGDYSGYIEQNKLWGTYPNETVK